MMKLLIQCELNITPETWQYDADEIAKFFKKCTVFHKREGNKIIVSVQKCNLTEKYMRELLNRLDTLYDLDGTYRIVYIPDSWTFKLEIVQGDKDSRNFI